MGGGTLPARSVTVSESNNRLIDKAVGPYFRDLYYRAPNGAKAALEPLAFDREAEFDDQTRRWLRRRLLLTPENSLNVPVFGRWLREELST